MVCTKSTLQNNYFYRTSKFSDAKKKKILAFSFQLCSTANSFYISFCEINLIKIQTMSLVLNLFYERLFVFYLLYVIIRQRLKKKFRLQQLNFFFSHANEIKMWSCAKMILGMLRDLILLSRKFQSLAGIRLKQKV